MTQATPAQIRAGIAAYITAHVTYTDGSGKAQPLRTLTDGGSLPSPPVAVVLPSNGPYADYEVALGGQVLAATYQFRLLILVSRASTREGTVILDGLLSHRGTSSIVQALANDPTCGGAADFVVAKQSSWHGQSDWFGESFMAGEMVLEAAAE